MGTRARVLLGCRRVYVISDRGPGMRHGAPYMTGMTFVETLHPRNVVGRFAEKQQTDPELSLSAPAPAAGECPEPVTSVTVTFADQDTFLWAPKGTVLEKSGDRWTRVDLSTWERDGQKVRDDDIWNAMEGAATLTFQDGVVYSDEDGLHRVPQSGEPGTDLFDGRIAGAEYAGPSYINEVKDRYARTPTIEDDLVHRGEYMHTGDGIWLHRCAGCNNFIRTYGIVGYLREFAEHEASHGLDVPGYNEALLPR